MFVLMVLLSMLTKVSSRSTSVATDSEYYPGDGIKIDGRIISVRPDHETITGLLHHPDPPGPFDDARQSYCS